MNNEERQAETAADGSTEAQVTTSSPTCSNTHVSGSVSLTANLPIRFAEAVKKLHKSHNVKLKEYKVYKGDWITVVVTGDMEDLKNLNDECSDIAYKYLD